MIGLSSWLAFALLGIAGCVLLSSLASEGAGSRAVVLFSRQSLSYTDRGMSWKEKDAVRKSKELQAKAAGKVVSEPSLVDKFMGAWKNGMGRAEAEWDYDIRPTLQSKVR